jgi:hypothetical protein
VDNLEHRLLLAASVGFGNFQSDLVVDILDGALRPPKNDGTVGAERKRIESSSVEEDGRMERIDPRYAPTCS